MTFDKENYAVETMTIDGETIEFRAFRNLVYVEKPVDEAFQQMNIYAPEAYYRGENINGYLLDTAPVFMPNTVGGYMPGGLEEPGRREWSERKEPNTIFRALQHGYVVAVPAIRGRVQRNEAGEYTGKAPACIVDYKAAVRYLHFFAKELPGDESKIITNGTSAGGALSALMGATGNHSDYEGYLKELGAAEAGDEIFAASCYCPITNLEHADMAYEWEFLDVNTYHRMGMRMDEGGRPHFSPEDGTMSEEQILVSKEEARLFPAYLNSLQLRDAQGNSLKLNENGEGSFLEYIKQIVLESARRAVECGCDVSGKEWLFFENVQLVDMDWKAYVRDITRMKTAPAFDSLLLDSPENDLFGSADTNCRHFTKYSKEQSQAGGKMAEDIVIKMLNPMDYIVDEKAVKASYWRIRHGECDRDTSLAISAILALKLCSIGCEVDYHSPWNMPHAGDYDLEELFAWIDSICK